MGKYFTDEKLRSQSLLRMELPVSPRRGLIFIDKILIKVIPTLKGSHIYNILPLINRFYYFPMNEAAS